MDEWLRLSSEGRYWGVNLPWRTKSGVYVGISLCAYLYIAGTHAVLCRHVYMCNFNQCQHMQVCVCVLHGIVCL